MFMSSIPLRMLLADWRNSVASRGVWGSSTRSFTSGCNTDKREHCRSLSCRVSAHFGLHAVLDTWTQFFHAHFTKSRLCCASSPQTFNSLLSSVLLLRLLLRVVYDRYVLPMGKCVCVTPPLFPDGARILRLLDGHKQRWGDGSVHRCLLICCGLERLVVGSHRVHGICSVL